jgi:uncharacterized protein YcgL (UPF0745 family)
MIKIDFEINRDGNTFRDAIVLEDNHNLTNEQIEEIKEKRFQDYLIAIQPQEEEIIEEINEDKVIEGEIIEEIIEGEI